MANSTMFHLNAFRQIVAALSPTLPLTLSDFFSVWNKLFTLTFFPVLSHFSDFIVNVLQLLVELLTVGLQLGVDIPTVDQTQQCNQGDLKQLILWGVTHNISWSFGDSILNIFLAADAPECGYMNTECQSLPVLQLGRSGLSPGNNPTTQLTCEPQEVTQLNDTLCGEVLASTSQPPDALYHVCKALSTLSDNELIQVWKNVCHMIQLTLLPLFEPCSAPPPESKQRVARSTLSISQLFCNYDNWTTTQTIEPSLVAMCSDTEPDAFLQGVCNNVPVMQTLIQNPSNTWVWEYCQNASDAYMVSQYCDYNIWTPHTIDPSIVAFCWNNDQARMDAILCQDLDFFLLVLSNQQNSWIMPNCGNVPTPQSFDINTLISQSCTYSQWHNLRIITSDQISLCIQNDEVQFISQVCGNSTLLSLILLNDANVWVRDYCTISLKNPPTPPPVVSITISPTTPKTSTPSAPSITVSNTTPLNTLSSVHNSTISPNTVLPVVSGTSLSTTVSLAVLPTLPSAFYSLTYSPSTPLPFSSTSSGVGPSPTKTLTVLPVATSINVSPSASLFETSSFTNLPTVSSNALSPSLFTSSGTPPAKISGTATPTVFGSTLSLSTTSTVSSSASKLTLSSSFFDTSMYLSTSATFSTKGSATVSPTVSSVTLFPINPSTVLHSSTTPVSVAIPVVPPVIPSIADLCKYSSWTVLPLSSSIVDLCWKFDMVAFYLNVCCNSSLIERLTFDPKNQWVKSWCSDNDTTDLVTQVCLYSNWGPLSIVDMTVLALCIDLDTVNFTQKVCRNSTVTQNLLTNLDNTWLLEQCSNLTGGSGASKGIYMGFKPSEQCQYGNWTVIFPDAALLVLCWDYDQANFISSVCKKPSILSHLIQAPSNLWVSTLCATYTTASQPNNTQSNITNGGSYNNTINSTNTTHEAKPCLVKELIKELNWSCSVDLSGACQSGSDPFLELQMLFRCGVEVLLPSFGNTMTPQASEMLGKAFNVWVVLLLVLEENGMTTLTVTDNIRQSVLDSVSAFLAREANFDNKQVLLQCFGTLLISLTQTEREVKTNSSLLIQEYFRVPLGRLRAVLSSVDVSTMRLILLYFIRNKDNLQLTDAYMRTIVAVLIQVHLKLDRTLFFIMGPVLKLAAPEDISHIPLPQNDVNVLITINNNINDLSLEQRRAFGWWFSQTLDAASVTAAGQSFIGDRGNVIAYLPFASFQHLSPAQLLEGLNVLLRNDLEPLKQQFIAQSIIGEYRNLTADQFRRLGTLTCLANWNSLMTYVGTDIFPVIEQNIRTCVIQGISVSSTLVSSVFLNSTDLQSPATLSSQRVSELAYFLPVLGVEFMQRLSQSQLLPILNVLASVPFTPTQAAVIIDKVSSSLNLSVSGALCQLGSLASGLRVEVLGGLSPNDLQAALSNFSQCKPKLTPPQANAIATKLWSSPAVITWLDEVDPLLSHTPLLCVIPRAHLLITNSMAAYAYSWNTQQAKTLFNEVMTPIHNLSTELFTRLGTVAQGVSCNALKMLFRGNASVSSLRDVLKVLREQSEPLHPSLLKCVTAELYKSDFFAELLMEMGSQIALSFPMSIIKKFPPAMTDSLRKMVVQDPQNFLLMPSAKQAILVDKIVQSLGLQTDTYTEQEFRSLGAMATFVGDEIFTHLDRNFFVYSVAFLRGFCYNSSKQAKVASMLQEPSTFGSVKNWTAVTLNQVDRFLFFLPTDTIKLIPPSLMSQDRIERLFVNQKQWESGAVGSLCEQERSVHFSTQQFVLQHFLGFLKTGRTASPVPSCESLHQTQPAVWPVTSLTGMSTDAFRSCLELIGQDPFFSPYQLSLLLYRAKEVYGGALLSAQLGRVATQLSADELASLNLSDSRNLSVLGAVNTWTRKQLVLLFSAMLTSTNKNPNQLNSSTFVTLGYIICGIETPVIRGLNAVEFSKAVWWLGRLNLSCSEDQLQAMVTLLSQELAFGPISSWGPEVFIEIGAFAAGIPDMAMSALVMEQIEGITPLAISLIPAKKFAVVFNHVQISWFSYEQATAITAEQRAALSHIQQVALSMVLNPLENKPVDFRGRSQGVAFEVCPLCHFCGVLVFLLTLLF
ncbi:stereocilin [Brachyhypopomus gauderio]|uniref:stereocilin n=1 Tax=Brachyhypopomus gauderio TaxID=698409 RepID=UPI004040FF5E